MDMVRGRDNSSKSKSKSQIVTKHQNKRDKGKEEKKCKGTVVRLVVQERLTHSLI